MSEEDDEGIEPIPTDHLLGGLPPGDDEGLIIIDTDWEQRGGGDNGEEKHG